MQRPVRSIAKWAALAISLMALSSYATNYSLWIKGRGAGGIPGNHADFGYWGPDSVNGGLNKRAINWDGYNRISAQNYRVRDALDCYCTGNNWCYVAAYSAGDQMIGYALALYGGSARYKKDALPNRSGQCTNNTFPDRSLMPRLSFKVHRSQEYPLAGFAAQECSSEERNRYLGELGRDMADAQAHLDELATGC